MFLIDTNILSFLIRENPKVTQKFIKYSQEICLCSLVKSECYFGAKRAYNSDLVHKYDLIFSCYSILSFDSVSSDYFVDLKVELERQGQLLEAFDLMIASICLANDLVLVTNNTKHFERIKGLKLEDWSK
ncbi:MAG: type II toxin-antitoxin system VapC family toxin [bacterium]